MNIFPFLVERFIALCEIPEMYAGLQTNSVTIEIAYMDDLRLSGYGIVINCVDTNLATQIHCHYDLILAAIKELDLVAVEILVENQIFRKFSHRHSVENKNPLGFLQGWALEKLKDSISPISIAMSNLEIDLNSLAASAHPAVIVTMHNQKLLYANDAALSAHQRKIDEFVGQSLIPLIYPDELEYRMKMLRIDKKLTNYEYTAMNWYRQGNLWRRQIVNLVSDHKVITFGGVECRLCIDLMVEETNRFID